MLIIEITDRTVPVFRHDRRVINIIVPDKGDIVRSVIFITDTGIPLREPHIRPVHIQVILRDDPVILVISAVSQPSRQV